MRSIPDASAESLMPFIKDAIEPGIIVHTDGWIGYLPVQAAGYDHEVTFLKGRKKPASELMPRVHRVASWLKRWLMGTHQGAVTHEHLDYYLDEFTLRFNRRRSANRGKLFYRCNKPSPSIRHVQIACQVFRSGGEPWGSRPQPIGVT
jgi:transposase-like protein